MDTPRALMPFILSSLIPLVMHVSHTSLDSPRKEKKERTSGVKASDFDNI